MSEPIFNSQTPAYEQTHLFRIAMSHSLVLRSCEHCGRTWLLSQPSHSASSSSALPLWVEILEEEHAREKLQKQPDPAKPSPKERSILEWALGVRPDQEQKCTITMTHALLPGSPALDAIPLVACRVSVNNVPLTTDQRGVKRPQGSACDIGAYEYIQ